MTAPNNPYLPAIAALESDCRDLEAKLASTRDLIAQLRDELLRAQRRAENCCRNSTEACAGYPSAKPSEWARAAWPSRQRI